MKISKIFLYVIITTLFTGLVSAEYDIDFKGIIGSKYADPFVTDKVDFSSSDILDTDKMIYSTVDFNIRGKGRGSDLNLLFSRYYNNKINNNGVCGYSWTTNLDVNLQMVSDLYTISDEKGEQFVFQSYYQYPVGTRYRPISKPNPHTFYTIPGYYILQKKYGRSYYFNSNTKLLEKITDSNGNQIIYTRDALNRVSSIKDSSDRTITFTYNASNKIASAKDPMNRTYTYGYDSNNNLTNVTDSLNNIITFEYTCPTDIHNISKIIKPKGNFQSFEYNQNDKLIKISENNNTTWTLSHNEDLKSVIINNAAGLRVTKVTLNNGKKITTTDNFGTESDELDDYGYLTRYTDKLNHITTMLRDLKGNVSSMTNARGYTTTQVFNYMNKVTQMTSPLNLIETYLYDIRNNLVKYTNGEGGAWEFTYSPEGLPLTFKDPNNKTTTYVYNNNGDLIKITDPLGGVTEQTFDLCGNKLTIKDPNGNITNLQYNNLNVLEQITHPDGNTRIFTFDENGNRLTDQDENGNVTTYTYNSLDKIETITDPENNTQQFGYDNFGRKISYTDPKGFLYHWEYDVRDRITKEILPDNSFYQYEYAAQSNSKVSDAKELNPIKMTDPQGNITCFEYNELFAKIKKFNSNLNEETKIWDALDRMIEKKDENNNVTKFTFNKLYKVTKIENALSNQQKFNYDLKGQMLSEINEEGTISYFQFDALSRNISFINSLNKKYNFHFDLNGNRISIVDPKNNLISYQYDSRNRKIKSIDAQNNTVQYFYDGTENIVSVIRADGSEIQYEYFRNNLLKSVIYPESKTVDFQYDANKNLTQMTDWNGTTLFSYDNRNCLTEVIQPDGNKIQYKYNFNGFRTELKLLDANNLVTYKINYTPDKLNRVILITDNLNNSISFTYDSAGRRTSKTYSNGITTNYLYNTVNHLTQIKSLNSNQAVISKLDYTLDKVGNILSETNEVGFIKNYTYDAIYQLTGVNYSNGQTTGFVYDDAGNRISKIENGISTSYSFNNLNQLISSTENNIATQFSYDLNGNLVNETAPDKTVQYVYNFLNKLSTVTKTVSGQTTSLSMNYDGLSKRISKTYSTGESCSYLYDGQNILLENSTKYIGGKTLYLSGSIDENFARVVNNSPEFYLTDNLNSLRKVVNSSQTIVNNIDYKPFGENLSGNAGTHSYLYTGREKDFDDLYYYRARSYSPVAGRFQQKDPIEINGGINLYQNSFNNPIIYSDPLGLSVTNNSGHDIYIKDENSPNVYTVHNGETSNIDIDGFSDPSNPGKAYKIPGKYFVEANVTLNADGSVTANSWLDQLMLNELQSGWQDSSFWGENNDWDSLFKASYAK
ncbi:MAG: hypothetical protein ACD_79C00988G0012 [uncultured bacterium]|nr:MAG: hypothetical protein ACD_79C00988G0012 [uncultured bacterium]